MKRTETPVEATLDTDEGIAIGVASGKGGVGKTTTALNLGAVLMESGYRVAIVDLDLGMANLGAMVGLTQPEATVHDVLAGRAPLDAALHEAGDLTVVPGSTVLDHFSAAEPTPIDDVVTTLRERFEFVILDVGAGLNHDVAVALEAADAVLLVTTAELPALTDASKTGELVERLDVPVIGAVFSGTGEGAFDDIEQVATALGTTGSVTVSIPSDPNVKRSVRKGMPVVFEYPESPASIAYKRLAASIERALDLETPASESGSEFEWVDLGSGELVQTEDPPGPVMEVPLEQLIEEAGLHEETGTSGTGIQVLSRVRSWFSE